ncbi:MAG TPA: hypothetical protein VI385_14680 [Flavisolibacter sp.]
MMKKINYRVVAIIALSTVFLFSFYVMPSEAWHSRWVEMKDDHTLIYTPDEKGNTIPDFSMVGYFNGDSEIPNVPVVKTISPAEKGSSENVIQSAINEVSRLAPGTNGFRGAILLKRGTYVVPGVININASGIILRGEGNTNDGTRIIAAGEGQRSLLNVSGTGKVVEVKRTRVQIKDDYVPVGAKSFNVVSTKGFKKGDSIIVYRPGTDTWIHDLKMDQIAERPGTKQWKASEYNLSFERIITKIDGNKVYIDNPIVMALDAKYGGGEIFKYSFNGRIEKVGVERMYFESEFANDTAENHGWNAVAFDKVQNSWVRNITARHFGNSCVTLGYGARNISVLDSYCYDPKSQITGGRRYSFNNDGQMNLFINCHADSGRHDFVTGARVEGPNVFVNCTAKNTQADIGPHHRWSSGTLYDNIATDGEINIQDRGNYGSGHGWTGATQILWNCTAKSATVQSPWVNGKNYCIGLKGQKSPGRFKDRPDGEWEGQNREGLQPQSLYYAQTKARQHKQQPK